MAVDLLTTSGINSLINSYKLSESSRLITPINTRKTKYQSLSTAYSNLSSKLDSLKSLLNELKTTGTGSAFNSKSASSSNTNFLTAAASSLAGLGSYNLRISQLAKSDIAMSHELTSSAVSALNGVHSFVIKTGDGSTGEFTSTIEVEFDSSDPTQTNKSVMEKIRNAINSDKAVVKSNTFSGAAAYSGGPGTLKLNLNGTETEISYNGGGTYEELIDELVTNISANTSGVVAEKVVNSPNPGDVSLKLTVTDSSKYISISHSTGADVVSALNIGVTKEKGASGIVTAASFSPDATTSQFSLTAKSTGLDFRIKELTDLNGGSALSFLGLNLGSSRPGFVQSTSATDTPGFMYSDITASGNLLNSRLNFNGLDIQRNSNSINDLVSGVTFTLKSVMQPTDTTVNVAVSNNVPNIKSKIEDFVTKFNEVYSYIKSNSQSSKDGRGLFVGDSSASSLLNSFASTAYTPVSGILQGSLNTLSQLGISFNSSTGLVISDSALLEQKLTESISQVEALFNSTDGIASKLFSTVSPYTGSTGYLANSISSLTTNIQGLDDRLSSVQTRINKTAESLRAQYQRLQLQLASLLDLSGSFSDTNSFF